MSQLATQLASLQLPVNLVGFVNGPHQLVILIVMGIGVAFYIVFII